MSNVLNVFAALCLSCLASLFHCQSQMTDVKVALFRNNNWVLNVNYLQANSSSFWREYILNTECETVVKFQEVFCVGKSVDVTAVDVFDNTKVYHLNIK